MSLNNLLVPNSYDLNCYDFDIRNQLTLENTQPVTSNQQLLGINSLTNIVGIATLPSNTISVGPINSSSTPDGMTLTSNILQLSPCNASNGGVIIPATQSIPGIKNFVNAITLPAIVGQSPTSPQMVISDASGNLGTQAIPASGVLSVGAYGTTPNANGQSITGTVLTQQPSDATHPGGNSITAQTYAGNKTFLNNIIGQQNLSIPDTTSSTVGVMTVGNMRIHDFNANPTKTNSFMGTTSGNFTMTTAAFNNTCIGYQTGSSLTTAPGNTFIGADVGVNNTIGSDNTAVGSNAFTGSVSCSSNTAVGFQAGAGITSGSNDLFLGANSGSNYTGAESNNILLENAGIAGENNNIRMGTVGTHTACAIAGIFGNTPASPQMCTINSSGILGSQAIPSGGSITLSAFGSTPNANGLTLTGSVLNMQPADATHPGGVSTTTQNFSGNKAFEDGLYGVQGAQFGQGTYIWNDVQNSHGAGDFSNLTIASNTNMGNVTGFGNNICIGQGDELTDEGPASLITTGAYNIFFGNGTGKYLLTGNQNIFIGTAAGSNYTGAESNNILIGSNGIAGESNVIRIGSSSPGTGNYDQNAVFIGPLNNSTLAVSNLNNHLVTINGSTGQLFSGENYNPNPASGNDLALGIGTITSMTVRGSAVSSPWPLTPDCSLNGTIVCLRIPQFQITGTTGGTGAILFTQPVVAGYRPSFFVSMPIIMNGSSTAETYLTMSSSGSMVITTTGTFSTPFGLINDACISYLAL